MLIYKKERLIQKVLLQTRPAFLASVLKKIIKVRRSIVETEHGFFYADPISNLGQPLTLGDEYEPEMRKTLERCLQGGSVFLDIGANEGYFSVIASKLVGESGRVIAVEPQTRLQAILRKNFELNEMNNATLIQMAISDANHSKKLYISPDVNTGSSSFCNSTRYSLPTETVPTMTLAKLFLELGLETVDLLKMDIEGFEYEAILGSSEIFREKRVLAFALELHPQAIKKRGLAVGKIAEFLEACGYELNRRFGNTVWTVSTCL